MRRYWTAPLRPKTFSRRTSTAVSSSRHFPGSSVRRRLKPADAVTVLYSAIFATAAVIDAGNKERHRLQHDRDVSNLMSTIEETTEQSITHTNSGSTKPSPIDRTTRASSRPRPLTYSQRRTFTSDAKSDSWALNSAVNRLSAQLRSTDLVSSVITDGHLEAAKTELNSGVVRSKVASIAVDRLLKSLLRTTQDGRFKRPLLQSQRLHDLRNQARLLEAKAQDDGISFDISDTSSDHLLSAIDNILTEQNTIRKISGSIEVEDCIYKICEALLEHSNVVDFSTYIKLLTWFANRGLKDPGLALIDACLPREGFRARYHSVFETWTEFDKFCCVSIQFCLRSNTQSRESWLRRICDLLESFEVKAFWTQHRRLHDSRHRIQGVSQYSDSICNSMVQAYAKLGRWSDVMTKLKDMHGANLQPHVDTLGWIIYCCGEKLRSHAPDQIKVLEIYRTAALVWPQYHSAIWETRRAKSSMWKTTSAFQAMLHLCSFSGNDQLAAQLLEQAHRAGMRVEYIEAVSKARLDRHARAAHDILQKDVEPSWKASAQRSPPVTETTRPTVKLEDSQDWKPEKKRLGGVTTTVAPSLALASRVETSLFERVQGSGTYAVV